MREGGYLKLNVYAFYEAAPYFLYFFGQRLCKITRWQQSKYQRTSYPQMTY